MKKNESSGVFATKCTVKNRLKSIKLSGDGKFVYYTCEWNDPKSSFLYKKDLDETHSINDELISNLNNHYNILISPKDGGIVLYKIDVNNDLWIFFDEKSLKKINLKCKELKSIAFFKDGEKLFFINENLKMYTIEYKTLLESENNSIIEITSSSQILFIK